jgi:hypothetical protein
LARQERIALPSELAVASGSRLDPKSLREKRDHLVIGLTFRWLCRWTVIAPRSASMQILLLKAFCFLVSGRDHYQGGAGGDTGFVIRAVFPQRQQQHGEFAGDGDNGALFLPGAARTGQTLAMLAQGAGWAEGTEDIVRGADEQAAQQAVAAFADAQLLVRAAALVAARTQTQIRPHIAAAAKPVRVADLQDEAQRGERADAGDLLETLGDGISFAAALHQFAFHPFDLFGYLGQHDEQRLDHGQTIGGHVGEHRFVKRFAGGVAHGMAKALEGEADGVDEVDAGANQGVAQLEAQEIMLGLGGTMLDGMEQRGIHTGQPGEHLGVAPVALAFGAGDGVELARVGDQDGGPVLGEVTADPRTVRAGLQRDGGARELGQQFGQGGPGVG